MSHPNTVSSARSLLRELELSSANFGDGAAGVKTQILRKLQRTNLATANQVRRFHDLLCFLSAYPDNQDVLRLARRLLSRFHAREDLGRFKDDLSDTGIAGTTTYYRFFAPTALWLARNWPGSLHIDWAEFENEERLEEFLPQLALYSESPALDECVLSVKEWVERLKGPAETDAGFLIRRFAALPMDSFTWETLYNSLDVPLTLSAGPRTPNRTQAIYPTGPVCYQSSPIRRSKLDVRATVRQKPVSVKPLPATEGRKLVNLARTTMVAYARELDAFSFASERDVTLVEAGHGLSFAFLGVVPERRLVFEAVYGYLILKNGVAIGYGAVSSLFGSSEIAFNVFSPFRGGEARSVFAELLRATRYLFESDTFTLFPYQLGEDNAEAIRSGAWWFYQKLGFRARDTEVLDLMARELKRIERQARYRSSKSTLRELACANVYLHLGSVRDDIIGILPLGQVGLRITDFLSRRFGANRSRASRACVRDAERLLGIARRSRRTPGHRLAWERWAPLVLLFDDLERWSVSEKKALAAIIDAKGGISEKEFVLQFDRHKRLRQAIGQLTRRPEE